MQAWSDNPVHHAFCVRLFLDTNILVYLIDNTYPTLNDFVEVLNESQFAEVISSRYAIFEFVGARKREHYLRIAASKTLVGQLNFSSLLKFRDDYAIPGVNFEDVILNIKASVKAEVEKIISDYNINFEYSSFHEAQLDPTFDICLASKISNQDCLIVVSSVLPQPDTSHSNVVLLTNDRVLVAHFKSAKLDDVLSSHSISSPQLLHFNNIKVADAASIKLADPIEKPALKEMVKANLIELVKHKLSRLYLGTTFEARNITFPRNGVCFKLVENYKLPENVYVTVISKDLEFIYTAKKKIIAFWHNGKPVTTDYILPADQKNNISFLIEDVDVEGKPRPVEQRIIDAVRAEGNLVFIHPDSSV
jgi:predicted nucleic acid-binding protein